jgi:hypothetical protein
MKVNSRLDNNHGGWNIQSWCESVGICRASFYLLQDRPKVVKLGRRSIVVESPADYLQRVLQAQREVSL